MIIMVKLLSVTIPNYLYDKVMSRKPYKNKSEWVQELLTLGLEMKEKVKRLVPDQHWKQQLLKT